MIKTDILIIGAGLTGLTIQYLLNKKGFNTIIIEARNRLGGRILTVEQEGGLPIEMGATWLGKKHTNLNKLLKAINIDIFPQILGNKAIYEPISTSPFQLVTLPENEEPSYRIKGGTSSIIKKLAQAIKPDTIYLEQKVHSITDQNTTISVESSDYTFESKIVISTLPPYLLKKSILFKPNLPASISNVMAYAHTWMGESIKFGLVFKYPFWEEAGSSSTVFSNVGPIPELYDHSNFEHNLFALKGFLNGSYFSLNKEARLELIIQQLKKYFGNKIESYTAYEELVWSQEPFTYSNYDHHVLPHQNNGHACFQKSYFNDKLFIAGSETSRDFPGYMEGAVNSAFCVVEQLKKH